MSLLFSLPPVVDQNDETVREGPVPGHHGSLERSMSCRRKIRHVGVCPTFDNQSDGRLQRSFAEHPGPRPDGEHGFSYGIDEARGFSWPGVACVTLSEIANLARQLENAHHVR